MEGAMSIQITPGIVKPTPDPWQEPGWIDRIVEHPSELESALRAVGIGNAAGLKPDLDKVFAGLISRFPEDFAPVGEHHLRRPEARAALLEGIKEIFTGLKKVEELKAELYEPKVRNANGLRSVAEDEWSRLVKTGKPIDRFDLPAGRVYELIQPASIAGFYFGNK
jgi:hypothetical protein